MRRIIDHRRLYISRQLVEAMLLAVEFVLKLRQISYRESHFQAIYRTELTHIAPSETLKSSVKTDLPKNSTKIERKSSNSFSGFGSNAKQNLPRLPDSVCSQSWQLTSLINLLTSQVRFFWSLVQEDSNIVNYQFCALLQKMLNKAAGSLSSFEVKRAS